MIRNYLLFFLATIFLSCHNAELTTVSWHQLEINSDSNLEQIAFDQNGVGHVVGGETWTLGIYGNSSDGGLNWHFDSLSNKRLYDLSFDSKNNGYAVGIDGHLFQLPDQRDWIFHRVGTWDTHRGVAFWEGQEGVIVSGAGFGDGVIQRFDQNFKRIQIDTFDFELQDVCYSNLETIHVAGYGKIMRSTNSGKDWKILDIDGDFFQEIQFVNEFVGYIVGLGGSILKTENGGGNWNFLRRGNSWVNSKAPFRALYFLDESTGYLAGEQGTLWFTKNGGEDWMRVGNLPKENFQDITIFNDQGYLAGEDGVLIRFDLL